MTRILVVDDDPHIVLGLETALAAEGYEVSVAVSGPEALTITAAADPDALILDLGLPGLDGLAVCRTLRAAGDRLPILVLTARDEPRDRVSGLDAGADDYLGKPFDLDELLARVRALVRRVTPDPGVSLVVGTLRLDELDRVLVDGDTRLPLTRIETALLALLFGNPHRTFEREQILDRVWEPGERPRSNALDVYVSGLRRKLESAGMPRLVHTVRGVGYRLLP